MSSGTARRREGRSKRVVVADPVSPEGMALLAREAGLELEDHSGASREELIGALGDAAALIVRSGTRVDEELLAAASALEVVGRAGVGVDNIDLAACTRQGVAVLNAPGGNTRSTAELAFALLLSAARNIPAAERSLRGGQWERSRFQGVELYDKTLGIVGLGRIGSEMAARGRAFGMRIVAHDPYVTEERADEVGAELAELPALLRASDFVTLHTPLTDETRGLVGAEELSWMKGDAVLVNAARGGLVDEEALAEALRSGSLGGAAMDVYSREPLPADHPLREAPRLVITPHLGASTEEARREVSVEIAGSVRDALLAGDLRAALNAPRIDPEQRRAVEPVLELGRRLGRALAGLGPSRCHRVEIRYDGPYSEILRPLAASTMVGFLEPSVDRPLNRVNALWAAEERGLEVGRIRVSAGSDYANYVEVTGEGEGASLRVGGALLGEGRHPRIVRIGAFHVDTIPKGTMLVIRNRDVPGVIGEVGSRLGRAGVNIAEYHQAREEAGGSALAVVTVDGRLAPDLLEELRGLEDVEAVRQVSFQD